MIEVGSLSTSKPSSALAQINVAKNALARVKSLEGAIEVRDRATAIAAYARAKGADEAHSLALEIKLRAERKAGGFLMEMEKNKGGRPSKTADKLSGVSTLKDLNIEYKESERWQRIAEIPEDEFEDYVSKTKDRTQAGLLVLASRYREPSPVNTPPLPEAKYRCIVVDPPWPMDKSERAPRPMQGKRLDYPTMSIEEISALKAGELADAERGCHVYLWTTHRFLPDAFQVFRAWGVTYHCLLTWVKKTGMTPFSWMFNTEHVLFGYIGPFEMGCKGLKTAFTGVVGSHSEKPDEFYELIKKASPAEEGERLDMFGRKERKGFEKWGA